ncbi:sensor histidine kinase, GAF domain-containing [Citrifermentans bemidjiense Bem]|uniref:histidine kinase n=2 Tax=Citrifermentans TaxID=2883512 RepID=B5EG70_CITBB|nr:ATP-binding protein [Citrifermentans bemidjiense]ACH40983.1 sensor histidine kinase, GAF domain-containing [Citrifermentans bemidjiense Bem]
MNGSDISSHVTDPARLAALRAVALLDTPTEEAFDRLSRLASRFASAPVALVTLVDSDRQFFKSCVGLPEPWLSSRQTPLSHSFCQYNRVAKQPLIIEDARVHPLFKENLAIRDLMVIAYLGIPLVTSDGYVLGSFCVIDHKPRHWSGEDVEVVENLAAAVMTEIQLRTEIAVRARGEETLRRQHEELGRAYRELEREAAERARTAEQLRQRDQMLIQQSRLAAMGEMINNIAHQWRQPLNLLGLLAQELPITYATEEFSEQYLESRVQKMMESIGHMSATIDNFRNFFCPEMEKVEFGISDVVEKTISLMGLTLKQVQINIEVAGNVNPVITGYPNQYAQVQLNILNNARDAFAERNVSSPKIEIRIAAEEGRSVLTVSDNAGGIPADAIDKVFDPYFTTKGPDKGTGIGLYMSKTIIEKNMGGSLTANNTEEGASFRIEV